MSLRHQCALIAISLISFTLIGSGPARLVWAAYYSDRARPDEFCGYHLVVLDGDHHPPLAALAAQGTVTLGYLSVGELEQHRAWYPTVKAMGILLGENPNWPGSFYVDLRDPRWPAEVVDHLVPGLLAQGFRGVFLDTLDDPVELERRDPQRYRGMTAAAAALVKSLRRSFPSITIMMNRGYGLLPEVVQHIDIELGESVYGAYDFARKEYRRVPDADYRQQVELLKHARNNHPGLRICSLDYWDPADREGIRRLYRMERANGFHPYVATIGLNQLIKEPH